MGLSGIAAADVLMDQIGDMDGSGIGTNIQACQDFEASFDQYDVVCASDFLGDGGNINMVEMVLGGWNGFVDPSSITGYSPNLYSSADAACASLTGDIASDFVDAADATISADWMGANFLISMDTELASVAGPQMFGVIPSNEFGTGGQTGIADSLIGGGSPDIQANPGGGFGFCVQEASEAAYRVNSGAPADPCTGALPAVCNADVDGDGSVAVSDVLEVIASWGQTGDGTYRPTGDCAPMPNGDCTVDVADILEVIGQWGADCTVYGGCCFGDGTCDTVSADDCAAGGGEYFGDNSDCSSGSCTAGACCISASKCTDVTAAACAGFGGTYKGDGTACATTDCAAIEPGDTCEVAIEVVDGANAFDTTNMTAGADLPECAEDAAVFGWTEPTKDVWLMWTASETDDYAIDTCDAASFDTSIVIYEGNCSNQVACNGDGEGLDGCQTYYSALVLSATAGETYYIRIGAYNDVSGPGTLNINIVPPPAPGACCFGAGECLDNLDSEQCDAFGGLHFPNAMCADGVCDAAGGDECEDALVATVGSQAFDTSLATPSTPEPDDSQCAGTYLDWTSSQDVWFVWTPDADGVASFDTCDAASYDTSMVLYEGSCDNQVACNGDGTGLDGCQLYYSRIADYPVTAGTSYYIRLGGWQAATGSGTLTISYVGGDAEAACCMADGSCSDATADDCAAMGGSWNSSGTCADVTCPVLITCDGSGYGPTPVEGAWTAGTSDTGAGFLRAADLEGGSGSTLTVWGVELAFNGGWGACSGSVGSFVVTLYDADMNVIEEQMGLANNGVETGDLYADLYPLVEYNFDVAVAGAAYIGVASESTGEGECWFLWMSADEGSSMANDGTGWIAEAFGVSHCLE
ncbi:MAG: hypothetical protein CMJ38_08965 [Phycisphaerae bacterium]|nr:hypothetical protein [Phycisphaerae bacterium]